VPRPLALALLLACRPAPAEPAPAEPTPLAEAAPRAEPIAPPPPEPGIADGWCYLEVFDLSHGRKPAGPLLRDRVASTDIVTLVKKTLGESDCTSVGHHHVVYEPLDAKDGSGLVRAYRSLDLPTNPLVPRTTHYLLGADVEPEHDVDLSHVCVSWQGRSNATPQWVLPIRDDAELPQWRERLTAGLCGRTPLTGVAAAPR
jgi:hypothetical protein